MTLRANPAHWVIANPSLAAFFMLALIVAGVFAFLRLPQSEDPPFAFKIMFVRASWPGATPAEMVDRVADPIERAVMQSGKLHYVRSYSVDGETVVLIMAKDSTPSGELPSLWYELRKRVTDIRPLLPAGVQGPSFNDDYGETFGNIYALTGDGIEPRTRLEVARNIEKSLRDVADVASIVVLGVEEERIWLELSHAEMARLGIGLGELQSRLAGHFAVAPGGSIETLGDRIVIRLPVSDARLAEIGDIPVAGSRGVTRLADIASLTRGVADPRQPRVRVDGRDALAIAVAMAPTGDINRVGEQLDAVVDQERARLPLGMDLVKIADQPQAVAGSVRVFLKTLAEAVLVVLAVGFLALGARAGAVVALAVPLVLAATFFGMHVAGIGLHKISLGALVLALGLLVDDAIIAVESMLVKLAAGESRLAAATSSMQATALPMLTGTLVTVAGFLPIATARSTTGEFTGAIFGVLAISLVASWIVAIFFIPFLGHRMLSATIEARLDSEPAHHESRWLRWSTTASQAVRERYVRMLRRCLHKPSHVLAMAVLAVGLASVAFGWVDRQFFPPSTRLELIVDLELPEGSSTHALEEVVGEVEHLLAALPGVAHHACFLGSGAPRFYLPMDQKLPRPNIGQCMVMTNDIEHREATRAAIASSLDERVPHAMPRVLRLENGPPVGYAIQYRLSGPDNDSALGYAEKLSSILAAHPLLRHVSIDALGQSKVARIVIDDDRAAMAGISRERIGAATAGTVSGQRMAMAFEGRQAIPIVARGTQEDRTIDALDNMTLEGSSGQRIPLSALAHIDHEFEQGIFWRRNGKPTVTVRADVTDGRTAAAVVAALGPTLQEFEESLADGYRVDVGGSVEESARGSRSVAAGLPWMVLVMSVLIMLQLRRLLSLVIVLLTVPLGIVGISGALLVTRAPFGFVALLGTIALSGMIMRNAIILLDQIDRGISSGQSREEAIVEAGCSRFRPIILTALTAILAMIPLSRSDFFGPMAIAVGGGLFVATAMTLFVVPALHQIMHRPRSLR